MKFALSLTLILLVTSHATAHYYKKLTPPKADCVTAFSNGQHKDCFQTRLIEKEPLLEFLRDGIPFESKQDISEYLEKKKILGIDLDERDLFDCSGVFATSEGIIYFWCMHSSHVLELNSQVYDLETSHSERCFLLLLDESSKKALSRKSEQKDNSNTGAAGEIEYPETGIEFYEETCAALDETIIANQETLEEGYSEYQAAVGEKRRKLERKLWIKRTFIEHLLRKYYECLKLVEIKQLRKNFPVEE